MSAELERGVERLRSIVADVERRLDGEAVRPELAQDASGRFILLDAYAALVVALTALEKS